ncbi:hypothetical protein RI129_002828 [Pyrocoelia pectoralis]|uniref:Uncharacterized protein n=1 Tax=Pyrocoelia pectoralis TaxID=417401 RepID=A0AAN7VML6_9COLE
MFIKIKHIHTIKLVKVEETFTYEDYVKLRTILDEDVLADFINATKITSDTDLYDVTDFPSPSFSPSSTWSVVSSVKSPTDYEWKTIITNRMDPAIFQFYDTNGFLNNTLRIKLVNCTCNVLKEVYGRKIPDIAQRALGQAIISIFPNLKDPTGGFGYEAFYTNNNGGEGFMSWRLRTINRASSKDSPKLKKSKTSSSSPDVSGRRVVTKGSVTLTSEVEHDFLLEFSKSNFAEIFTIGHAEKVLNIYSTTASNPCQSYLDGNTESDDVDKYDKCTRAILAISKMVPMKKTKTNTKTADNSEALIIVFKKVNQTIDDILNRAQSKQPFLIAQGTNKGAITQYNVAIDGK